MEVFPRGDVPRHCKKAWGGMFAPQWMAASSHHGFFYAARSSSKVTGDLPNLKEKSISTRMMLFCHFPQITQNLILTTGP